MADIVSNGRILANVGTHSLPGELNKFVIFLSEVYVQTPDDNVGIIRWHLVARRDEFVDANGVVIPASWIVFDREYAYDQITDGNLLLYPNVIYLIHQHVSHQYDILGQYRNIFPQFTPNDVAIKANPLSTHMLKTDPTPEPLSMLGDGVTKEYVIGLIDEATPKVIEAQAETIEVKTTGLGLVETSRSTVTDLMATPGMGLAVAVVFGEVATWLLNGRSLFFGKKSVLFGSDKPSKKRK